MALCDVGGRKAEGCAGQERFSSPLCLFDKRVSSEGLRARPPRMRVGSGLVCDEGRSATVCAQSRGGGAFEKTREVEVTADGGGSSGERCLAEGSNGSSRGGPPPCVACPAALPAHPCAAVPACRTTNHNQADRQAGSADPEAGRWRGGAAIERAADLMSLGRLSAEKSREEDHTSTASQSLRAHQDSNHSELRVSFIVVIDPSCAYIHGCGCWR